MFGVDVQKLVEGLESKSHISNVQVKVIDAAIYKDSMLLLILFTEKNFRVVARFIYEDPTKDPYIQVASVKISSIDDRLKKLLVSSELSILNSLLKMVGCSFYKLEMVNAQVLPLCVLL